MYAYAAVQGLTLKEAKAILRQLGMSINKNQYGEYRVNFLGGDEAGAYYTNDLEDAVNTGKSMAGMRPVKLMPNPSSMQPYGYDENPMSKGTKTALMIGGGVAVVGVAAYFLFFRSSTTAAAGTTTAGGTTSTGGTRIGSTGPTKPVVHLMPIRPCPPGYGFSAQQFMRTGNGCTPPSGQQGQQGQGQQQQGPQPAPSPIVVQNGSSATYQAPPANSLILIQLPQYTSVGSPTWSGSGTPGNLGAATSGGIPTLQLIMPGGPGTLSIPWTNNTDNSQGNATITFV